MYLEYEKMLEEGMKRVKNIEEKKRFVMPKAIVKWEGQKTLIKNFSDIAKVFRRDPKHLAKFLAQQLAAPSNIQEKVLCLQGRLSKQIIQKKIEEYAKIYVICKECKSADTKLIKEGRIYYLRCEACGARSSVR